MLLSPPGYIEVELSSCLAELSSPIQIFHHEVVKSVLLPTKLALRSDRAHAFSDITSGRKAGKQDINLHIGKMTDLIQMYAKPRNGTGSHENPDAPE